MFNKADFDISDQNSLKYLSDDFSWERSFLTFFCLNFLQELALFILRLLSIVNLSIPHTTIFHSHPCLWRFKIIKFFRDKQFSEEMKSLQSFFLSFKWTFFKPKTKEQSILPVLEALFSGLLYPAIVVCFCP